MTRTGRICQDWHSQTPHAHTRTPEAHPEDGLVGNKCRNPHDAKVDESIWCYTTDPDKKWEYCDPIQGDAILAVIEYSIDSDQLLHIRTVKYGFFELFGHVGGHVMIVQIIGFFCLKTYAEHNFFV